MLPPPDFLKGTLSTIILSLLKEQGKMYGYEICQLTKSLSNETITISEGSIYPALHKLEKQGLITSSKELYNGRMRKYYSLNVKEKATVVHQINALHQFLNGMKLVLQSK